MAPYQGIARGGGHLSIDRGRGYCWLFRPKVRNAVLSTENSNSIEEIKMKYLQAAHNKIVSGKGCGDRAL